MLSTHLRRGVTLSRRGELQEGASEVLVLPVVSAYKGICFLFFKKHKLLPILFV